MNQHVSREIPTSAADARSPMLVLMHEARKARGFKSGASFRAIEKTIQNPDGSPEKVSVLFVRTGKESLLEKLESWWNRKEQRALARQLIQTAFPELTQCAESDRGCMPWFMSSPRIRPNELAIAVPQDQSQAAAYSLALERMARDIKPVLAKNERASARQIPSVDSIVDLFPGSELDFCSRLGLSRKIGNLASLNELSGGFATLLMALSRQPVANMGADEQKELIEGARTFCLSWYGQREVKPNMAKRNPHIATVNFLVARFLRHDPAYEGQQTGPDLPGEMVRGKTWKAILYQGNRPGKSPTRA